MKKYLIGQEVEFYYDSYENNVEFLENRMIIESHNDGSVEFEASIVNPVETGSPKLPAIFALIWTLKRWRRPEKDCGHHQHLSRAEGSWDADDIVEFHNYARRALPALQFFYVNDYAALPSRRILELYWEPRRSDWAGPPPSLTTDDLYDCWYDEWYEEERCEIRDGFREYWAVTPNLRDGKMTIELRICEAMPARCLAGTLLLIADFEGGQRLPDIAKKHGIGWYPRRVVYSLVEDVVGLAEDYGLLYTAEVARMMMRGEYNDDTVGALTPLLRLGGPEALLEGLKRLLPPKKKEKVKKKRIGNTEIEIVVRREVLELPTEALHPLIAAAAAESGEKISVWYADTGRIVEIQPPVNIGNLEAAVALILA